MEWWFSVSGARRDILMRELPPPDDILLPNDHAPILWVSARQWACLRCHPRDDQGSATSVSWIGVDEGTLGRCHLCGQKWALGDPRDTHYPSVDEQLRRGV